MIDSAEAYKGIYCPNFTLMYKLHDAVLSLKSNIECNLMFSDRLIHKVKRHTDGNISAIDPQ